MSNYDDFGDILVPDFETPQGVPDKVEGEARDYYRHPTGTYLGFVGKPIHKFVDSAGKYVEASEPGAVYKNSTIQLWITKFLGNTENPVGEVIISPELKLPDRPIAECYFPIAIMPDPKRQWSYALMFKNWKIPGHAKYDIIQASPTNPANKVTFINGFPAYQGLPVKFTLTYKPEEGKSSQDKARYVEGEVEILDYKQRIPMEKLTEFYKQVEARFEKEREERKARNAESGTYNRDAVPDTNYDALANAGDDLESFMKGE